MLISRLIKETRGLLILASIACVIAGSCGVLLIATINDALAFDTAQRAELLIRFLVLSITTFAMSVLSSLLFESMAQQGIAILRKQLASAVIDADYAQFEKTGHPPIQAALTDHVASISGFFQLLPQVIVNGAIVLGAMAYLAWLSWQVFLMGVLTLGFGYMGYHLVHLRAVKHLNKASNEQDRLFKHFAGLLGGAKELRLNARKRAYFSEDVLTHTIDKVRQERTRGMSIFMIASNWGGFLTHIFVGLVVFWMIDQSGGDQRIGTGYALVLVFMMTPLEALLVCLPEFSVAALAAQHVEAMLMQLSIAPVRSACAKPQNDAPTPPAEEQMPTLPCTPLLQLSALRFQFKSDDGESGFALGPINLSIHSGEILFIVGGNGSGKSALAKLICGLYIPDSGQLIYKGQILTADSQDRYRQYFSAVFSDFHLFDELLSPANDTLESQGKEWLQHLKLNHKVSIDQGSFSTTALSSGQRKRLALVVALLEQKSILLFDEWAADQDPEFKRYFYLDLLPALREQGKTIIAITHDDRYFSTADHLVCMDAGCIISDIKTSET
ncbi:cyclic peptide transporter [Thauera phenylacetica B4P]|uniref:Cyclic peptide transporter n=1 Tax=Thauera phenylacetica B4P TaxID=1234382 RepID=N7A441_9RHOO|nr:cyclic peptide export ABC transporter [Thauera phenylacetica]ENO99049.1 cyclic peptide transporter [Thauera phenylacetica B4P]